MLFIFILLVGMYILRKLGWFLSKTGLYILPSWLAISYCVLWGIGVAILLQVLTNWLEPHWILRIIGYGFGAYCSVPNYGLFAPGSIPEEMMKRHNIVTNLPLVVFALGSIIFWILP